MIRKLRSRIVFKVAPPIEFNFEFQSVRIQGDMPDFKAVMVIDKFANCSSEGPVLKLEGAKLQSWNLTNAKDGSPRLNFQIAGRTFDVSEIDVLRVFNYLMNTLPHLWKKSNA
jgi:hypothetical protein